MKTHRLLTGLTVVNLALLGAQLLQPRAVSGAQADVPRVIRAHALEIVDASGRVRASLSVVPEDPKVMWQGKAYPETVLLRLITADGRPNVKLGESRQGGALVIAGESNPAYVQALSDGGSSTLKLVNKAGVERAIMPQ
jgi:hypothetical protein